ncbi:autotransporter-associated beta strand repeat-containing protein [Salmonella enterica]|uniref:autotransporter-associated beta strand repeat-containing protein n=1 Tax=Salmonella enterica TaxID=28901 RepID=UPI00398C3FBF
MVKTGNDELTLSGENSYTGGTTITGGTLTADQALSLSSCGLVNRVGLSLCVRAL